MRRDRIIDLDDLAASAPRSPLRRALRVSVPVLGVLLIAGGIAATAYYQYTSNRAGALALSKDMVEAMGARIESRIQNFLKPPADAAAVVAGLIPKGDWATAGRERLETVAIQLMQRSPQVGQVYVGRANGDFMMIRRREGDRFDTKLILHTAQTRAVTWIRRDAKGNVTNVEDVAQDDYDPRVRGWYRGALKAGGVYWSDVYVFFTDNSPGVTVAMPAPAAGDGAVVGVDIRLETLSAFLSRLEEVARGRLVIVDGDGGLVAAGGIGALGASADADAAAGPPRLQDLGDPVLIEANDRLHLRPDSVEVVGIDGVQHLIMGAQIEDLGARRWRVVMAAPESAFAGFVQTSSRHSLIASAAIVLLAVGLAGTLAVQVVQADRTQRRADRQDARWARQMNGLETLVGAIGARAGVGAERAILPALCETAGTERAGVWRREAGLLQCVEQYDADRRSFTAGTTLTRRDAAALFDALDQEIAVADAGADPRTRELALSYLAPLGMDALLSVPIRRAGAPKAEVAGVLWLEGVEGNRLDEPETLRLVRLAAGLLALEWGDPETASAERTDQDEPRTTGRRITSADSADADVEAAVAVLRVGEPLNADRVDSATQANGASAADDTATAAGPSVVGQLVARACWAAEELAIPYVKALGGQVVVADGLNGAAPAAAAARLARFALLMRDACTQTFLDHRAQPAYAIGLDYGPVRVSAQPGAPAGTGTVDNLWGEALDVADGLATTATVGRVQISADAEALLDGSYLRRASGAYYLERVGTLETFDLRGTR